MKQWKLFLSALMLALSMCAVAAAQFSGYESIAPDYHRTFGGSKATVEMNDGRVLCAIARLQPLAKTDRVALPASIKKYDLMDAGGNVGYLFIPHYKHTRFMVRTATKNSDGQIVAGTKLLGIESEEPFLLFTPEGEESGVVVNIMTRTSNTTRVIDYAPGSTAEAVLIPAEQRDFLKDVTGTLARDGQQLQRQNNNSTLGYFKQY